MSVESCTAFLRVACESSRVRQQLKALTGVQEIVRLGRDHGYRFDARELAEASSSFDGEFGTVRPSAPGPAGPPSDATAFYHHEYDMADVPGLAALIDDLPQLKIKPPAIDLTGFHKDFRHEDLQSTEVSPAGPEYRRWMAEVKAEERPGAGRRDFHLINLDDHIDHPGYSAYFAAKTRVIAGLERLFGSEVRFSGSLWYPPSSYRLWHTNETQPGWRMYLIDFDEDLPASGHTSYFRYLHPDTGELVTLRERPRLARFFKVEQDPDRLFWHCIVNPTDRHRWSFGFAIPDNWRESIMGRR